MFFCLEWNWTRIAYSDVYKKFTKKIIYLVPPVMYDSGSLTVRGCTKKKKATASQKKMISYINTR